MKRFVLSFGGNALGITHNEQILKSKIAAKAIVDIAKENSVIVVTGNGPISGNISLGLDYAFSKEVTKSTYSLANIGGMTQGSIGDDFQIAIQNELKNRNIDKKVVTILTHTIVEEDDVAFNKPTKPIGAFYSSQEAEVFRKEKKWTMIEDSGRGYRRVVASPMPKDILEKDIIQNLVDQGYIVICGVGGGIPTTHKNNLNQIDAVIDKDFTSALIAKITNCDSLILLTAAPGVALDYGTPQEKWLKDVSVSEIQKLIEKNYFPDGSMGPKVKAAMSFTELTGHTSVIADLNDAQEACKFNAGTRINK